MDYSKKNSSTNKIELKNINMHALKNNIKFQDKEKFDKSIISEFSNIFLKVHFRKKMNHNISQNLHFYVQSLAFSFKT